MKTSKTARGFAIIEFDDSYNKPCEIQKSSLATDDAIWFGRSGTTPLIMSRDAAAMGRHDLIDPQQGMTGWVDFPVPEQVLISTRMHLTRKQVSELLPVLQHFVDTGDLPPKLRPKNRAKKRAKKG